MILYLQRRPLIPILASAIQGIPMSPASGFHTQPRWCVPWYATHIACICDTVPDILPLKAFLLDALDNLPASGSQIRWWKCSSGCYMRPGHRTCPHLLRFDRSNLTCVLNAAFPPTSINLHKKIHISWTISRRLLERFATYLNGMFFYDLHSGLCKSSCLSPPPLLPQDSRRANNRGLGGWEMEEARRPMTSDPNGHCWIKTFLCLRICPSS